MRAATWQGRETIEVVDVADPRIEEPTDAIVRVTSTAICGSDLHLWSVLGMHLDAGDALGHEATGVVEEVGLDGLLPLAPRDDDPLGVLDLRTHRLPLEQAPQASAMFRAKDDGCVTVVLEPAA